MRLITARARKPSQRTMDELAEPLLAPATSTNYARDEDTLQDAVPAGAAAAAAPPPPAPPSSGPWHRAWSALRHACAAIYYLFCQCWRGRPQAPLSLLQESRLEALRARIAAPYDETLPEHREALQRLWAVGFPGHEFPPGVKSARWKEMGWQQESPGTDFRGGGFLSLELLVAFAERQTATFLRLMRKEEGRRSEWEYPFAAAGVNLAFMLVDALDLRDTRRPPRAPPGRGFLLLLGQDEEALEVLFVECYKLLDAEWLARGASYMEFPFVLR